MDKKMVAEIKEKLEEQKASIEAELKKFATKDEKLEGDWDTKYPRFNEGSAGGQALEEAADEVERYSTLLPIEHSLELRLQRVNEALDRIKKGTYGTCEKCGKAISKERLGVSPEAADCGKCK